MPLIAVEVLLSLIRRITTTGRLLTPLLWWSLTCQACSCLQEHEVAKLKQAKGDMLISRGTLKAVRLEMALGEKALTALGLEGGADRGFSNAFIVGRPPHHHHSPGSPGGFCPCNTTAYVVEKATLGGKKVAVVDVDAHLGDGTEHHINRNGSSAYFSVHMFGELQEGGGKYIYPGE